MDQFPIEISIRYSFWFGHRSKAIFNFMEIEFGFQLSFIYSNFSMKQFGTGRSMRKMRRNQKTPSSKHNKNKVLLSCVVSKLVQKYIKQFLSFLWQKGGVTTSLLYCHTSFSLRVFRFFFLVVFEIYFERKTVVCNLLVCQNHFIFY